MMPRQQILITTAVQNARHAYRIDQRIDVEFFSRLFVLPVVFTQSLRCGSHGGNRTDQAHISSNRGSVLPGLRLWPLQSICGVHKSLLTVVGKGTPKSLFKPAMRHLDIHTATLCLLFLSGISLFWAFLPKARVFSSHEGSCSIMQSTCSAVPGCILQQASGQTFAYRSPMTGRTVAELNWEGQLNLYALYQPENDIPEQRVILEELYHATAGDGWQPLVYHQTEPLQQVVEFMAYYASDPGMLHGRWQLNVRESVQILLRMAGHLQTPSMWISPFLSILCYSRCLGSRLGFLTVAGGTSYLIPNRTALMCASESCILKVK